MRAHSVSLDWSQSGWRSIFLCSTEYLFAYIFGHSILFIFSFFVFWKGWKGLPFITFRCPWKCQCANQLSLHKKTNKYLFNKSSNGEQATHARSELISMQLKFRNWNRPHGKYFRSQDARARHPHNENSRHRKTNGFEYSNGCSHEPVLKLAITYTHHWDSLHHP